MSNAKQQQIPFAEHRTQHTSPIYVHTHVGVNAKDMVGKLRSVSLKAMCVCIILEYLVISQVLVAMYRCKKKHIHT